MRHPGAIVLLAGLMLSAFIHFSNLFDTCDNCAETIRERFEIAEAIR